MSEHGRRLLSVIISKGDASLPLRRGVTAEMFRSQELGEVWRFVRDKTSEFGSVPSAASVKLGFPTLALPKVSDPLELVLEQFLEHHRDLEIYSIVDSAVDLLNADKHADALASISSGVAGLDALMVESTDIELSSNREERLAEYMEPPRADGLLGLATGFSTIDEATAGLQPGQLVTLIASPKSGKSIIALKMAQHLNQQGSSVLFHGFEMSNEEQQVRFDAIGAGVSSDRLRRRVLNLRERNKLRTFLEYDLQAPFVLSDSKGAQTVPALAASIAEKKEKPDVVFIDGAYFLFDEASGESNTSRALTNVTRSLKRLAQRLEVPIVITTQTLLWKMKGVKLDSNSIGYSSSFLQDSDVILGLERDAENEAIRNLRVIESRNCGPVEVVIAWDWETSTFAESAVSEETDLWSGSGPYV